ncbi:MAG: energy transducer TonB [Acidobacteriota bacterium]|nr:energy transducer TonB [Acidobacteriota bacterium]
MLAVIVSAILLLVPVDTVGPSHGPCVAHLVAPAYPRAAKDQRMQGDVVANVKVNKDGSVGAVRIVSAHPVFATYVSSALEQWTFKPSESEASLDVRVRFVLDFDTKECEGADVHPVTPETYVSAQLPSFVEVRTGIRCIESSVSNVK